MNERIRIDFTHKPGTEKAGKVDNYTLGDLKHARELAQLLRSLDYPIHDVWDVYKNQPIDWQKDEN